MRLGKSPLLFLVAFCVLFLDGYPAFAELSASGAFSLIRKIPPGEDMKAAGTFLGEYSSEKIVDEKAGIKIRSWGTPDDEWYFDVLHDGKVVRACRITWTTNSRGRQQTIFAQLSTAGKQFFGKPGVFRNQMETEWTDFDGKWLVRAKQGANAWDGVMLLSGIRDQRMDSGKYGF